MKIAQYEINQAKQFLGHLSVEELRTRLAKLEKMGKETAARVEAGQLGDVIGERVHKGEWVPDYSAVSALNSQRLAWKQTRVALGIKLGTIQ